MVRFSDHLIYIKQFARGGALCILTDGVVNVPALKMAINLAHRKLAAEIGSAQPIPTSKPVVAVPAAAGPPPVAAEPPAAAGPPAAPEPAAAAAQVTNGAQPPARRTPRTYRGHLVED